MKKHLRLIIILTVLATILSGLISCSYSIVENEAKLTAYETKSNISKQDKSPWKLKLVQIGKDKNIQPYFFYNENVIYGVVYNKSEFTLYKTLNGGEAWEKLSSMTDFGINDIYFVTPNEGFIALYKLASSPTSSENESYIMKTENGGLTWKTVHSWVNTTFSKLNFNSDGIGAAVGRRGTLTSPVDDTNFVLLTNDNGQTWIDVSENLNRISTKSNGRIEDLLTNVIFSKDRGILVLSLRGKIFNSTDQGKSWSLISKVVDEPQQTGFNNFGELQDGKF